LRGNHPYRRADNLLATPHIGYVSRGLYERFYQDSVNNISAWLDERLLSTTKENQPRLDLFNNQRSNGHE
jgi:phosphoglycerate dehydrogenase-like enzyme